AIQADSRLQTGFVDVSLNNGQPSYTIGEDVAWDAIAWEPAVAELAQQTTTVCYGTLAQRHQASRLTLQRFLQTADNATKMLDINFRKPFPNIDVIDGSLKSADILKCNEDELFQMADWLCLQEKDSSHKIAAELQRKYELRAVFWTCGPLGCRW